MTQEQTPEERIYPVLPKSFVQDKQFEVHEALSALHRVTNRWWENVQRSVTHDPRYMARSLRGTAKTLLAIADQLDVEIKKATIPAADGDAAGQGAAAGEWAGREGSPPSGDLQSLHQHLESAA